MKISRRLLSLVLFASMPAGPAIAWDDGYSQGYENGYSGGSAPGPMAQDPYARGYRDGLNDSDDAAIEQEERQQRGSYPATSQW